MFGCEKVFFRVWEVRVRGRGKVEVIRWVLGLGEVGRRTWFLVI